MTGSEMQREKEKVAQKMREKQAAGRFSTFTASLRHLQTNADICISPADAKKAAEAAEKVKK